VAQFHDPLSLASETDRVQGPGGVRGEECIGAVPDESEPPRPVNQREAGSFRLEPNHASGRVGEPTCVLDVVRHHVKWLAHLDRGWRVVAAERDQRAERILTLFRLALRALTERDTALIRRLTLSQAEFAWYYYPSDPQAYPPYDLDPQMMWFPLLGNSDNGLRQALQVYGGRSLRYRDGRCEGDSSAQGENVLWGPCSLGYEEPDGQRRDERLLKLVIRRGGAYKVVSWANKLD
jgi:hypothetical protein